MDETKRDLETRLADRGVSALADSDIVALEYEYSELLATAWLMEKTNG